MMRSYEDKRSIIPCVILAGGESRRFGADKALARLHGVRLIDFLIKRLEAQTKGPIAINSPKDYDLKGRTQLVDKIDGSIGPLAGIHAALHWAHKNGFETVITTPVDTPILPDEFIRKLENSGAPSVAVSGGRTHSVHGLWHVGMRDKLEHSIKRGLRAAWKWAEQSNAKQCIFNTDKDHDPFFNVNTPEDLAKLSKLY